MALTIQHCKAQTSLCTKIDTRVRGKNIAVGNIWENRLVSPTLVNYKEVLIKAHITNTSNDLIDLAKGTMEIQNEMITYNNEVLINTTFLINKITTTDSEEILAQDY